MRDLLITELAPVFLNVKRRITKNADGVEGLSRQVKYALEDFDQLTKALNEEYKTHKGTVDMCMGFIEDPTDAFKTVLLVDFDETKKHLDDLNKLKDESHANMDTVVKKYHLGKMTSSELALTMDAFLIPDDAILNKSEATKKK